MPSDPSENPNQQPAADDKLPTTGEHVWVECGPWRTLAYRDTDGTWRAVATNEKLTVTRILRND